MTGESGGSGGSGTGVGGGRCDILGIGIDPFSTEDCLAAVRRAIETRTPCFICTANVDHLMKLQEDPVFRNAYGLAAIVTADGMPLVWAARFLGRGRLERVTGADLAAHLVELAAEEGRRLFLLGGVEGVAAAVRDGLVERDPRVADIVDCYSPPFGFERDGAELDRIDERIRRHAPEILLIGLGAPKQEKWYAERGRRLGVPVVLACGGALDFLAGRIPRAPEWMRRAGLEWLFRLGQEPRRLWRRYLLEDPPFFRLVLRQRRLERKGGVWRFPGGP